MQPPLANDLLMGVIAVTVGRGRGETPIEVVHVLCPVAQDEKCAALLNGTGAKLHRLDADPPPWRAPVQASRTWAVDGLPGGVGGGAACAEGAAGLRVRRGAA